MTDCFHPNLPALSHTVLPRCLNVLPSLSPQCSPFVLPCHAVSPYYLYMKGELYCTLTIYLTIYCICPSVPVPHQRRVIPGALIHIPLNDQPQCWSPATVAWQHGRKGELVRILAEKKTTKEFSL